MLHQGKNWDNAVDFLKSLPSDKDAKYDEEIKLKLKIYYLKLRGEQVHKT